MKKYFALILIIILCKSAQAQVIMDNYKVGAFTVSLPDYMSKTGGLNPDAAIQFRNMVRDVSGYIIREEKTVKLLDDPKNLSIDDYYKQFINSFLIGKEERKVGNPVINTNGNAKFIQTELTYLDDETVIYYYNFIGIIETKNAFYKVICTSGLDFKNQYKNDFIKIFNSVKD